MWSHDWVQSRSISMDAIVSVSPHSNYSILQWLSKVLLFQDSHFESNKQTSTSEPNKWSLSHFFVFRWRIFTWRWQSISWNWGWWSRVFPTPHPQETRFFFSFFVLLIAIQKKKQSADLRRREKLGNKSSFNLNYFGPCLLWFIFWNKNHFNPQHVEHCDLGMLFTLPTQPGCCFDPKETLMRNDVMSWDVVTWFRRYVPGSSNGNREWNQKENDLTLNPSKIPYLVLIHQTFSLFLCTKGFSKRKVIKE